MKTLILVNETYEGQGEDFGKLEAYRSNTVGKSMRMTLKNAL